MAERVVADAEARAAAEAMRDIISGSLTSEIDRLNRHGEVLMEPLHFEGRAARQFRSQWPEFYSQMRRTRDAVEDFRRKTESIINEILKF